MMARTGSRITHIHNVKMDQALNALMMKKTGSRITCIFDGKDWIKNYMQQ